jgi:STE24 endopeptidase
MRAALLVLLLMTGAVAGPVAQERVPDPGPAFDPVAATAALLATVPADARARSDAYAEGGYWVQLWAFLWGAAVNLWLLHRGRSAAMRDRAERWSRWRVLQVGGYWAQYLAVTTLLTAPLTVYAGFVREHQYGLATQGFGPWLREQGIALALSLVIGALAVTGLYRVFRAAPRSWWLWGGVAAVAFIALGNLVAPVFIAPLFNTYTRLADPSLRDPILAIAHANGIPADDVFVSDASRQTTRISANVSGMFGTMRITLNDNLLKRGTREEVLAVMGHEMGHYVLNHVYETLVYLAVLLIAGFAVLRLAFERAVRLRGEAWDVRGIGDVAGLPLLSVILSTYLTAMTPVLNSIIRSDEAEADAFGLNAAGQPDGFATVSLKLGEYRKLAPGRVEELLLFDHPSGRSRILMAMTWKAYHSR